jgi:hypothetical protein
MHDADIQLRVIQRIFWLQDLQALQQYLGVNQEPVESAIAVLTF